MAYALEKPLIKIVLSFMPGKLAILTWSLIIMAVACVIPLVFVGANPLMETDMDVFGKSILYVFAAVIQMMGVFALGISLTGNGFTNVVASLMILVVPRAILTIIISMIESFMPFIQKQGKTNHVIYILRQTYSLLIIRTGERHL